MSTRLVRRTLVVLAAALQTTCVHPAKVPSPAPAPPVNVHVVPYVFPDSDQLCVQQPNQLWSCIHLGDLRRFLWSLRKA